MFFERKNDQESYQNGRCKKSDKKIENEKKKT